MQLKENNDLQQLFNNSEPKQSEPVSSPEDSPDQKTEQQNTLIMKSQRRYLYEVQERNDEAIRVELIE